MSVFHMSISAGLLVIAIVLIRSVGMNKLPKKMFLVLWSVVLFRLLLPVSIPMPFSVPNIFGEVSRTVLSDATISLAIEIPFIFENLTNVSDTATGITIIPGTTEQIAEAAEKVSKIATITVVWLAGMFSAFIFFSIIYYKNNKSLCFATAILDNDFLNTWLAEHKHIRKITIMQSDRIISPLAVGILQPRIILPKNMDMDNEQLLNYVLTHEYYHIKRFDVFWKILLILALCVHWFNPMAWLMFVLANRDLELTCDEMVIRRFGATSKTDYAYMLIGMVEHGCKFAPLYNGFSKNAAEERIVSIMKIKKTNLITLILAFMLVLILTVSVLASSDNSAQENAINIDSIVYNTND